MGADDPRLQWVIVLGGVLSVAGAFLALSPALSTAGVPDWLATPATIGELWMIGALLVGVREGAEAPPRPSPAPVAGPPSARA